MPKWFVILVVLLTCVAMAQQPVVFSFSYAHVTGPSFTIVKNSSGLLHTITINTTGQNPCNAIIYDSVTNSGQQIAVIDCSVSPPLYYDVKFANGLTIDLGQNSKPDLTVSYQ